MIHRIRARRAFEQLSRNGTRFRSQYLWCIYLPDPIDPIPRVAFAIGKTVGPAVVRNRLRRRVRSILSAPDLVLPPGLLLFGARVAASEQTFDTLRSDLIGLVRQLPTPVTRPRHS